MATPNFSAPALSNKISSDIESIRELAKLIARLRSDLADNAPDGTIIFNQSAMNFQIKSGSTWHALDNNAGKYAFNVDKLDGFHANAGVIANSIVVRDSKGVIPGNISGRAPVATEADELTTINPISKGGTGASTSAQARANLGTNDIGNLTIGVLPFERGGTGRNDGSANNVQTPDVVVYANTTTAKGRGQIGNLAMGKGIGTDANIFTSNGRFWFDNADALVNFPKNGVGGSLDVRSSFTYCQQEFATFNNTGRFWRVSRDTGSTWTPWAESITSGSVGDGIEFNNGVISVPEYGGATTSESGTAGIVPPAAAGKQDLVLTGGGEWKYPKDVAIGGDQSDLASARGQIGDPALGGTIGTDANLFTINGRFWIDGADAQLNFPKKDLGGTLDIRGKSTHLQQEFAVFNKAVRFWRTSRDGGSTWSSWSESLTDKSVGDGIKVTDGIISVPEYGGATSSASGTAGLVPPAMTYERDQCLCGDGSWDYPGFATNSSTATKCTYTPNIAKGFDGDKLPYGGTWRVVHYQGSNLRIFDHPGGYTFIPPVSDDCYFIAFRIA